MTGSIWSRQLVSYHFNQHGGDVVFAPAVVGELNQVLDDLRAFLDVADGCQFAVAKIAVQSIGTQQVSVARAEVDETGIDLDVLPIADRAGNDIAMRRAPGLLWGNQSLLEFPTNEGVVFGQLYGFIVANLIDAAVSNLSGDCILAERKHRADGGSHAALGAIEFSHGEDHVGGGLD